MNAVRGTVINIHHHGAIVRLEDGTLAAVPPAEFTENRVTYVSGHRTRTPLALVLSRRGGHPIVAVAAPGAVTPSGVTPGGAPAPPRLVDAAFEAQMNAFLKSTEEGWTPADSPPAGERHFIRKKRRAALFEARNKGT